MARPKGWTKEKTIAVRRAVWEYLKANADEEGYLVFNSAKFALDRGVDSCTIQRCIRNLAEEKKIEYTRAPSDGASTNSGSLVRLIKIDGPKVVLRVCPKCGAQAHDEKSRFCHRCGTCLLSWDEQLRIKIDSLLPKIYREINDSKLSSELSEVMAILTKKVFKEEA